MIRFASVPANILKVEEYIRHVFQEYHIDEKLYPNILVSITEAVNNAIIHGNKEDHSKFVHLNTVRKKTCISFKVSDEGPGFDPKSIPDPTLPENIERCGGRGVFLMQKLSDRVVFSNKGRTVEIQFRCDAC
ncbi:MAG: ATP-binding protein [Bacteroidota bacterium]|nr:ATP-binding protein [Bacteroidota bacterium]